MNEFNLHLGLAMVLELFDDMLVPRNALPIIDCRFLLGLLLIVRELIEWSFEESLAL